MPKRKKRNILRAVICISGILLLLSFIFTFLLFQQVSDTPLFPLFRLRFLTDVGRYEEKRTLTIFTTVLKADDDPLRHLAQENCIKLLSDLDSAYVIVFTNDIEWIRVSRNLGVFVVSNINSNEFGTPFLRYMFMYAMDHFNSDYYGYVNADILLDNTIIRTLQSVTADPSIGNRVYLVGQRTNVQQELTDVYEKGGSESPSEFVIRMLLKGHRYWDSAVDYHIVSRNTWNWTEIPDFVIGRSGYDLYLVQSAYLDPSITMIDLTNSVHCAHMLSLDGNRSGIKRKTPDNSWNMKLLQSIPGGCCQFRSFGKLANYHTVELEKSICVAQHGFEGYYDDSYYDTEKEFIRKAMNDMTAENCFLVSDNDVLGLLMPYCKNLVVIIINVEACERTYNRFKGCGVDIQLGCNRNQVSTRDLVLSMFQRIDTMFDLIMIQSDKPMVMIRWVVALIIYHSQLQHRLTKGGVLIMRRWLDPIERREIEKVLQPSFVSLGIYPLLNCVLVFLSAVLMHLLNSTRLMMSTSEWRVLEKNNLFERNRKITFTQILSSVEKTRHHAEKSIDDAER